MENNLENGINITPADNYVNTATGLSTPDNTASLVQTAPPKKKKGAAAKVIALALCCSLAGGAAGAGGVALLDTFRDRENVKTEQTEDSTLLVGKRDGKVLNTAFIDTDKELTASEIYAANVNSTVGIQTSVTTNYFGYKTEAAACGSGFILTADGYIVTNYHVVEGANKIKVTAYDDTSYDAKLIGYDESNDIAVLKVDAKDLTPVVLGDSDNMNVGDSVIAIGNPLGELTFSLTSGSVSALNRKITINHTAMNLIQTDCAINSGNSGGALFNSYGEVIGITNAKYSGSGDSSSASIDNIGFAIPINSVRDIITSIIEKGYIEKAYIGVTVSDMVSDYQVTGRSSSGDDDILQGAVVRSVEEDGPADKAGIKENDVITAVNGEKITGTADLCTILANGSEGDKYILTIYRDGETLEIKVKLGLRKQDALPEDNTVEGSKQEADDQNYPYQDNPGRNGSGSSGNGPFGDGSNSYDPFGDGSSPFGDGQDPFGNGNNPFSDGNTPSTDDQDQSDGSGRFPYGSNNSNEQPG